MTWLALRAGNMNWMISVRIDSQASEMGHFSRLELAALLPQ